MTGKEAFVEYCKKVQFMVNQYTSIGCQIKPEDIEIMFHSSTHNVEFMGINLTQIYKDLEALEMLKKALTVERKIKPMEFDFVDNMSAGDFGDFVRVAVEYENTIRRNELDEELKSQLTKWIMENIDKEKVEEWLKNGK